MFDVGFSELLLLGVVALVILGPEKLPIAMRTLGRYYAKFKHTLANLQHSIDQEFKVAELKAQMQKELDSIKKTETLMRIELDKMHSEMLAIKHLKSEDIHSKAQTPKTTMDDAIKDPLHDSVNGSIDPPKSSS